MPSRQWIQDQSRSVGKESRMRGFTLIEILVVVIIVAILMGVVVNAFGGAEREQSLRGFVERTALRIEAARDRATQSNREWGLYLDEEGVAFAQFDELSNEWIEQASKPFARESFEHELRYSVKVEEFALPILTADDELGGSADEKKLPNVVLFSSGETTPFEIVVEAVDWETDEWYLSSDGFSRTQASRTQPQ